MCLPADRNERASASVARTASTAPACSGAGASRSRSAVASAQPSSGGRATPMSTERFTTCTSAAAYSRVSAPRSCRRPARHAIRRSISASDCSPRSCVASQLSRCIANHAALYSSTWRRASAHASAA